MSVDWATLFALINKGLELIKMITGIHVSLLGFVHLRGNFGWTPSDIVPRFSGYIHDVN